MSNKKHVSLTKLARAKASNGYGFSYLESAVKKSSSGQVVEGALLELVLRFNQAIKAWAQDRYVDHVDDAEEGDGQRPDFAVPFPGIKHGTILYSCDELEDGITRAVVIEIDKDECVRCVTLDPGAPFSEASKLAHFGGQNMTH